MSEPVVRKVIHEQEMGMRIDVDMEIVMDDGIIVRCDVYRPDDEKAYPAILTYGPYGKGMHFSTGYAPFWNRIKTAYPEILEGTSGKYMNWETVDPEKWVPKGYAIVRIDSRGAGRSEGIIDCLSSRETKDFYNCIEFIGEQPWCDGNVGLLGISYYAMTQWRVAAERPPHLKAIIPFEGSSDFYREMARHGGIRQDFSDFWYPRQVRSVQHGLGRRGLKSDFYDSYLSGPESLDNDELEKNRVDMLQETLKNELITAPYYTDRNFDLTNIEVPVLSCGSWGGAGLHLRGNTEGYLAVSSKEKFLEIHGLEHFTEFYTDYGRTMQQAFFDHYLKGQNTWHQAPVHLRLRNVDGSFTDRDENEWPIARTQWTKFYFNEDGRFTITPNDDYQLTFSADDHAGISFFTAPLEEEMVITGPIMGKLFISSTTTEANIHLTMRVLDPNGKDITFISANDYFGQIANGWLRASHRKIDPAKSTFYRPWHTHDEKWPLVPGEKVECDVEVWPTSVIIPKGYRLGFCISGCDFDLPDEGQWTKKTPDGTIWKDLAIYTHRSQCELADAPEFHGDTTLHSEGEERPYILLPVIPQM